MHDGPTNCVVHNLEATPEVLSSFGVWFSAVRGKLGDDALLLLSEADPVSLWRPLKEMYSFFASLAATEELNEDEKDFVEPSPDLGSRSTPPWRGLPPDMAPPLSPYGPLTRTVSPRQTR